MNMSIIFPKIGLFLENVPKSLLIGDLELTLYGVLIALGMLLGLAVIFPEAKRRKQNTNDLLGFLIVVLICGIIGARFAYVLFAMPLYRSAPLSILNLRQGGMSFYGGLFGGLFGGAAYAVIRDISFGELADTAVPGILVAQTVGSWGHFFDRSGFGGFCDWVTAMQLPMDAVRADEVTASLREQLVTVNGASFIQVHPVFFYDFLWCLLVLILVLARRGKKLFAGELLLKYLTWYGFGRFFLDLLRTDRFLLPDIDIPISAVVSVLLFVVSGILLLVRQSMMRKRAKLLVRRKEEFRAAMEQAEAEVDRIGLEGVMEELEQVYRKAQEEKAAALGDAPEEISEEVLDEAFDEGLDEAPDEISDAVEGSVPVAREHAAEEMSEPAIPEGSLHQAGSMGKEEFAEELVIQATEAHEGLSEEVEERGEKPEIDEAIDQALAGLIPKESEEDSALPEIPKAPEIVPRVTGEAVDTVDTAVLKNESDLNN